MDDTFELYDLELSVEGEPASFVCSHKVGPNISVKGENLKTLQNGGFSLYALAALLPLIPAKQRETHKNDWMSTDEVIACPDPHCGAKFRITRLPKSSFKHSEVTKVPLKEESDD